MYKILFVEDDALYKEVFTDLLLDEGYLVDAVESAAEGIRKFKEDTYDMVLTDLQMKTIDGSQLLVIIRKIKPDVKVIILTASESERDELKCLDLDVNEYLIKTTPIDVLLKRIERVFKHKVTTKKRTLTSSLENLEILDNKKNIVKKNEKLITLTRKEMDLLVYFLNHKNQVLQRDELLKKIWHNNTGYYDSRTIDTYVKKLRAKLHLSSIISVRGVGYEWAE